METPKNIDGLVNWKAELENTLANIELQISESAHDAAIVLVDLAESTALKHKRTAEHWLSYIYGFLQLVRDVVAKSDGILVKRMGDGALVSFGTTEAAQNFLDSFSRSPQAGAFPHRAAAEFGKVYAFKFEPLLQNDPYGQAVDRCARILERCRPGLTLYGAGFYKSTADKARFHSAGCFKLRGFPEPEELFFREPDPGVNPAGYLEPLLETLSNENAHRPGYRYVPRVFSPEDITSWTGRARPFLLRELINVPVLPWSYGEFAKKVWSAENKEEMFDYYGMLVDWEGEFHEYSRSADEITVWVHNEEPRGPTAYLHLPLFMFDVVRLFSKGDRIRFRGILSMINIVAIELNYVDIISPEAPS